MDSERLQGASKLDLTVTVTPYTHHTTHHCYRRHRRYNRYTLCPAEAAGDSEWRRKAFSALDWREEMENS
jgi:hypothetical protein